jgi:hypothetical protein
VERERRGTRTTSDGDLWRTPVDRWVLVSAGKPPLLLVFQTGLLICSGGAKILKLGIPASEKNPIHSSIGLNPMNTAGKEKGDDE